SWTKRRRCLFTLTAPDPAHSKRAQASAGADDCQGKEESEDHMQYHQQTIDSGNTETESDLIASPCRRGGRVGHHVERVEEEGDARHRHQPRNKWSIKKQASQRSLCDKAAEPCSDEGQPSSEARVQECSCANDSCGQNPVAETRHVLRELIRRRDANP